MSQDALACACEVIGIDEAGDFRIVIPGLQVVKAGLGIKIVPSVAEGIVCGHGAGAGNQIAVRVVAVLGDVGAAAVHNPHHVTLQIGDVVVEGSVVLQRIGSAVGIVEEVQGVAAVGLSQKFATGIVIGMLDPVHGFGGSDAVSIVGKAQILRAVGGGLQIAVTPILYGMFFDTAREKALESRRFQGFYGKQRGLLV